MASEAEYAPVLRVESGGAAVRLTLNRPAKRNALNCELNRALAEACRKVPDDAALVVLSGAGPDFCAGSDLFDLYQADRAEAERVLRLEIEACHALAALPQLTVVVLHGRCRGGGAILPLYCDLRIGCAGVSFALPEASLGWAPPYGIERMLGRFPRSSALEVLLSGRVCGDQEALRMGWIDTLVGPDPAEAQGQAALLAERDPRVVRDILGLAGPRDAGQMRGADEKALAAFLNHFDTELARRRVADFVERKRR